MHKWGYPSPDIGDKLLKCCAVYIVSVNFKIAGVEGFNRSPCARVHCAVKETLLGVACLTSPPPACRNRFAVIRTPRRRRIVGGAGVERRGDNNDGQRDGRTDRDDQGAGAGWQTATASGWATTPEDTSERSEPAKRYFSLLSVSPQGELTLLADALDYERVSTARRCVGTGAF